MSSGVTVNYPVTQFSKQTHIDVENGISLNGAILKVQTYNPQLPGTLLTIFHNVAGGTVTGTFKNLPQGSVFLDDKALTSYLISYLGGGSHDVTLTVPWQLLLLVVMR